LFSFKSNFGLYSSSGLTKFEYPSSVKGFLILNLASYVGFINILIKGIEKDPRNLLSVLNILLS